MEQIFRRILDDDFSDLAGLAIDASIPVPEHLINEIIAAAIRANDNIRYCRVSVRRQNRISVNVKSSLWPWPLELKLRLDWAVDFKGPPRITARLENKVLLARIGAILKVLPVGISIRDAQIAVDIGAFLSTPEQKRILDLIRSVAIDTDDGKVILDVKVVVDDDLGDGKSLKGSVPASRNGKKL